MPLTNAQIGNIIGSELYNLGLTGVSTIEAITMIVGTWQKENMPTATEDEIRELCRRVMQQNARLLNPGGE